MSYRKNYLLSHDIDWFCRCDHHWIHVASRGGLIPNIVDDEKTLPRLQALASNLRDISEIEEVIINEEFVKERYERAVEIYTGNEDNLEMIRQQIDFNQFRSNFIDSFADMARKGFYSFARINIDNPTVLAYRLIAKPTDKASEILFENLAHIPDLFDNELKDYLKSITLKDNFELEFDREIFF